MNWRFAIPATPRIAESSILLALVAGGTFSYYQVGSALFACGRDLAGPELRYWLALAAVQSLLFVAAGAMESARRVYRWSQYLALPLLGIALAQVALAYPRIFIWLALLAAAYWLVRWLPRVIGRDGKPLPGLGDAVAETTVFLLTALMVLTAIAFVFLHWPGRTFTPRLLMAAGLASFAIAAIIVRWDSRVVGLSIAQVPPLGLLIAVVLRAKFPDAAFDSLFYKATIPITIGEWGTAITGVFDHTLLGTDFAEIMGSQLRMLDPTYSPAMTSTLSFLALWIIAPLAARGVFGERTGTHVALVRNVLALLLVSLTEAHIAAGTAYHEPLMGLLMAGFLMPMSVAWLFLGAAIASKFTVLFVAPVLLAAKAAEWMRSRGEAPVEAGHRGRVFATAACMLLGTFVLAQQFERNLDFTGRLLGVAEVLVDWTDPRGEVLTRLPPGVGTGQVAPIERYGRTLVHMLTLDRWVAPAEDGFHVMPSSRVFPIALVLAVCFLLFASLRRQRAALAVLWICVACGAVLMSLVSQGRHFHPLSFAAAVAIAFAINALFRGADPGRSRALGIFVSVSIAVVAFGDQLVGSFINNGWICERSMAKPVIVNNYDRPDTDLERKLAEIASAYRAHVSQRPGVIPSILCENTTGPKHYLGVHHAFAYPAMELTMRYIAADPRRASLLPSALLALCFTDPQFPAHLIPAAVRGEFTEVPPVGGVRILVSKRLLQGAPPQTLLGAHADESRAALESAWTTRLVDTWSSGVQPRGARADTPTGTGAFPMQVDGDQVGVLVSPYRITFEGVQFGAGGRLLAELAMLYPNSDGMSVDLVFETAGGARHVETVPLTPPAGKRNWAVRDIALPKSFDGPGSITLIATSPSGNSNADWALVRKLDYRPGVPPKASP